MSRPRLLDLFCGAGGAAMGYHRAGFDVVGVDIVPQPNYPFEFHRADAFEYVGSLDPGPLQYRYTAIHASPPCQKYSSLASRWPREYPDLIGPVRELLTRMGLPYVIENVDSAPLARQPDFNGNYGVVLCGSMFNLPLRRHRVFESNVPLTYQLTCRHLSQGQIVGVYGHTGRGADRGKAAREGRQNDIAEWGAAMGIDWMTVAEIAEAIPPAYTEFIGHQLMAHLKHEAAA